MHQGLIIRLLERLLPYLRAGALPYMAVTSPADISWGRGDVTVRPDLFVAGRDEAASTPDAQFPRIERERLAWHPEGADEPLVIPLVFPLAELFAEP